jgi:hypothetical protein
VSPMQPVQTIPGLAGTEVRLSTKKKKKTQKKGEPVFAAGVFFVVTAPGQRGTRQGHQESRTRTNRTTRSKPAATTATTPKDCQQWGENCCCCGTGEEPGEHGIQGNNPLQWNCFIECFKGTAPLNATFKNLMKGKRRRRIQGLHRIINRIIILSYPIIQSYSENKTTFTLKTSFIKYSPESNKTCRLPSPTKTGAF